jgi:hypothetical protein
MPKPDDDDRGISCFVVEVIADSRYVQATSALAGSLSNDGARSRMFHKKGKRSLKLLIERMRRFFAILQPPLPRSCNLPLNGRDRN